MQYMQYIYDIKISSGRGLVRTKMSKEFPGLLGSGEGCDNEKIVNTRLIFLKVCPLLSISYATALG